MLSVAPVISPGLSMSRHPSIHHHHINQQGALLPAGHPPLRLHAPVRNPQHTPLSTHRSPASSLLPSLTNNPPIHPDHPSLSSIAASPWPRTPCP